MLRRRDSFSAEEGCHDDLVMCMVIYAWAVAQDYFKEMTDQSVREELYEKDKTQLEEDMSPLVSLLGQVMKEPLWMAVRCGEPNGSLIGMISIETVWTSMDYHTLPGNMLTPLIQTGGNREVRSILPLAEFLME